MSTSQLKIMAAAAILLVAGAGRAATVTFDNYVTAASNPYFGYSYVPLVTDGFSFTSEHTPTGHFHLVNDIPNCDSLCVNDGSNYLGLNMGNLIMTKVGGGAFSASMFDSTSAYLTRHIPATLRVEAALAGGGSVVQVFALTQATFKTFHLTGFDNITSLTFRGADANGVPGDLWFAMDNIVTGGVPAIPEPATYGMLLAGLAAVALRARRRA